MNQDKDTANYTLRWPKKLRDQYKKFAKESNMTVHSYLMNLLADHSRRKAKRSDENLD